MHIYGKTREERKRERSERASRAANARWEQYHEVCPAPVYDDLRPEDMYRITVENLMTGEAHVLLFHPGPRIDNYQIDVDGRPWRTCGWTEAVKRLRKSCVKLMRRAA